MSNGSRAQAGFSYQRKYTLYVYLNSLIKRELSELSVEVNLSIPYNREVDVQKKTQLREKHYFEIKSGEGFKDDNLEIQESVLSLYQLRKNEPDAVLHLIISPEFRGNILEVYRKLKRIRDKKSGYKTLAKQMLRELKKIEINKNLRTITLSKDRDSFIKFLENLYIEDGPSDKNAHGHEYSPLEIQIIGIVDQITKELNIMNAQEGLTSWDICLRLLEIIENCCKSVDSNNRIISNQKVAKMLTDAFGRNELIASYNRGEKIAHKFEDSKKKISSKITQKYGLTHAELIGENRKASLNERHS